MKPIITEELRLRKRICDYALSCGNNAEAARRYHTSRQNVSRWLKRYYGTIHSLRPHSRCPKSHSRAHTAEELALIEVTYRRHKKRGLAEVYVGAGMQDIRGAMARCVIRFAATFLLRLLDHLIFLGRVIRRFARVFRAKWCRWISSMFPAAA